MRSCVLARLALVAISILLSTTPVFSLEGFDPHGTGPGYPAEANGRNGEKPSLPTHRITGSVVVDGRLDEADWINAPAATGFTQFSPDRLGEPGEETVCKVIYDDDAIYFGVACLRTNGSPITSCLSRRDNIVSSDHIRLYISPYHDLMTGYHFRVNPDGVKEDYYNYGDLYHDSSWDAVWDAETFVDAGGWYAEIRIPFSSIRYRAAESMTWGFNLFQYIHSLGERSGWSNWTREQSGFMSRSGTITGIRGIRSPRQLEITPYILGSVTDPADPNASGASGEDWVTSGNIGADIKYGVTPDLTLNATVQPDFGQVEADPSVLNLSPYETYYQEKRPFFVEGAQFFWHPDFTVFYSRRIGTGTENSRIRAAAKLTGKVAGNVSTALLFAATDEAGKGQAHNLFKSGNERAYYGIGRFGKEFKDGQYAFNLMQTAVVRDHKTFDYATRNGYTSGADFELNFKDRMYQATGSFVGSIIKPLDDPGGQPRNTDAVYGTGSRFEFEKRSGEWTYALTTRHQSDKLDLNDMGYLNDPDHYAVQAWLDYDYNADDETSAITMWSVEGRYYRSWIYAARDFAEPNQSDATLWSYDRGHRRNSSYNLQGRVEFRNNAGGTLSASYRPEGSSQYKTRWTPDYSERGPLMSELPELDLWTYLYTDGRKDLTGNLFLSTQQGDHGVYRNEVELGGSWVQNTRITHSMDLGYVWRHADSQWIGNYDNPGGGIGNVSYVFGELDQRTWDLTLRSSVLFTRNSSLELYLQPYYTVGDYANARELATPDSYDLRPYDGLDARNKDFSYAAVNLNLVYRWEYRPGSTIFVVWSHSRDNYDRREFHGAADDPNNHFDNGFCMDPLTRNEGENRVMVKMNYWFSL